LSEEIEQPGIPGKFDYLRHTADIYVVAYGSNLLELLENAGLALFHSMTDLEKLEPAEERAVEARGFDLENTLYRWLEELLILYYSENFMCREVKVLEFSVRRENGDLAYTVKGVCRGEKFNPAKHEPRVEVKAVTYHLMRVVKDEELWRAYFVLDI